MLLRGWLFALTGKAADAVQMITSGLARIAVNGSNNLAAVCIYHIWRAAHAELGQFDDAWRCISEAMTMMETTKERWCEAEVNRMAGEIALKSPEPDAAKAEALFRARARGRASTASKILGTPRRNEHGAALARSGQAG